MISLWEDAIHGVATQRQVNTAALALIDQLPAANKRAGPVRDNPRLGLVRPPGEEEDPPPRKVGEARDISIDSRERSGDAGGANGALTDRTGVRIATALEDLVGLLRGRDERDKEREKKEKDREKRERDAQREKEKIRLKDSDKSRPSLTQLKDELRTLTDHLDDFHSTHFQTDTKEQEYRDLRRQLLALGDALCPPRRETDTEAPNSPHEGNDEEKGRRVSGRSAAKSQERQKAASKRRRSTSAEEGNEGNSIPP